MFNGPVLTSFKKYIDGLYDDEIVQKVLVLLERVTSDGDLIAALLDNLQVDRTYYLHACLTLEGGSPLRPKLFAKYPSLAIAAERCNGHTFDLPEMRKWFSDLAASVMHEIGKMAT